MPIAHDCFIACLQKVLLIYKVVGNIHKVVGGLRSSFLVNIEEEDIPNLTDTNVSEKEELCDINASFDGTWQHRSCASLNGVVPQISIENAECFVDES